MLFSHKFKAFTLVELIVVITIITILGTIGFLSYTGYLVGARDSNRLTQLQDISNGLSMYSVKSTLPLPDSYVTVKVNGTVVAYQGYMGQSQLDLIGYSKGGKDPKDQEYFTYYLSADQKQFQLLGYLEDASNQIAGIFPTAYAANYTNRYITTIGKKLGVLTEAVTNQPIQAVSAIASTGTLDIATTTNTYTAWFTDKNTLAGTGAVLNSLGYNVSKGGQLVKSCKALLSADSSLQNKDGMYVINPTGTAVLPVYCDMTVSGGGWTKVGRFNKGNSQQYNGTALLTYPTSSGAQFDLLESQARLIVADIKNVEFYYKHQYTSGTKCEGSLGKADYSHLGATVLTVSGSDYMCVDMDGNGYVQRSTDYVNSPSLYVNWGHCADSGGKPSYYNGGYSTWTHSGRNMCDGYYDDRSLSETADWTELYIR